MGCVHRTQFIFLAGAKGVWRSGGGQCQCREDTQELRLILKVVGEKEGF